MIEIDVNYKDREIHQISISGHSGYAEAGSDIVCAAISALTQTIGNSLLEECGDELITATEVVEDNIDRDAFITITNNTMDKASQKVNIIQKIIINTLLKTLIQGYKSVEKQYPANVVINEIKID